VRLSKRLTRQFVGTKRARRRTVRYSLIAGNLAILVSVGVFIATSANSKPSYQSALAAPNASRGDVAGPLDQISSVDVAVNVARTAGLTESVAVTNQSDSTKIMNAITPADTAVVSKPQVVATNVKTGGDIQVYVVQAGDTVPGIAAKFNVTSDSIRWSNELRGDNVRPGTELVIPPVTGIVYTVLIGDTPDSIAQKFRANKDQLIAFNDAEINGFQPGQRIVVPNGQKAAAAGMGSGVVAGVAGGGAFSARYGYNGYDPGWCTWYAASRVSVPTNWGNASTWDDRARLSGWTVSQIPRIGAIAQRNGGWGHVGIVEDVRQAADGSWEIRYSDMNGLAGFNRVGYSGWVPAIGKYQNFIYR
jgi:LysM repeat protein